MCQQFEEKHIWVRWSGFNKPLNDHLAITVSVLSVKALKLTAKQIAPRGVKKYEA